MTRYQEFSESSLSRCLVPNDFFVDNQLSDSAYRREVLKKAAYEAENRFPSGLTLGRLKKNKKVAYYSLCLSQRLVLRKCASNLKKTMSVKLKSRTQIARELQNYLAEGTPYRVYRLDIKDFFESINSDALKAKIHDFPKLSTHTKKIIISGFDFFEGNIGCPVPRGVETSPLLSELTLMEFDRLVLEHKEVVYFSRFVDDIVVITSACENKSSFIDALEAFLPGGLRLNKEKTKIMECKKRGQAGDLKKGKKVLFFEYLGFSFTVYDSPLPPKKVENGHFIENKYFANKRYREVCIDLSRKKVKKIKSRLCKAFYAFYKDNNYSLLRDRVWFLATNRSMVNKNKGTIIPVGVYYSSSPATFPSEAINELDIFLTKMVTSRKGRLCGLYGNLLTKSQKRELLQYNFTRGFNNRLHKRYSANRLSEIVRVWR